MKQTNKTYRVGTLTYSLGGVLNVSFWLLFGAFWYDLIEYTLVPTLLPLLFKKVGASAALMGLFLGSVPSILNFFVNPIVSTASDKTRSRWGRRKPFLAASVPFIAGFGIALGWIPELASLLHGLIPVWSVPFCSLILLCACSSLFYFSGLFIGTVGCYLPPDVVPFSFIGRFNAAGRLVATAAGFLFNFFLMQYADQYAKWLFTGVGIAFAVCYTLMLVMVREGEYPPVVKDPEGEKQTLLQKFSGSIRVYFKECFSQKFFIILFLGIAVTQVSTRCRGLFNIIFATKDLGMSTGQYGTVAAVGGIATLIIVFSAFLWVDRINPLLGYAITGIPVIVVNIWGYFFVHDYDSFYVNGIAIVVVYTFQNLFFGPLTVLLLPKEKYGQFCSAMAMVCCLVAVVGSYACGVVVDFFGTRWIYVWDLFFTFISTFILIYCLILHKKQRSELHA